MNPSILLWARVLMNTVGPILVEKGKGEQAQYLREALLAIQAGKNVDDTLRAAAERWESEGEPTVEQITEDRKAIQALMG